MVRRVKKKRTLESYRAARRNAVLRPEAPAKPRQWRGIDAKYRPWMAKPPILKFDWGNLFAVPPRSPLISARQRKQPKTYPVGERNRERERRTRQIASGQFTVSNGLVIA